jgi:hypothetical protein
VPLSSSLANHQRASFHLLLFPIVLLVAFATLIATNHAYFHGLLFGAPLATEQALQTASTNALFQLDAPHALRTGVHRQTRSWLHPWGQSGQSDSEYYETIVGHHVLILRIAGSNGAAVLNQFHFRGHLQPLSATPGLEATLKQALSESPNLPPMLPMYLDTTDNHRLAAITAALGLVALLSLLWRLRQLF